MRVQARLWACGRGDMSTPSFDSHLNPISTRGAEYALPHTGVHTKFLKPQARLHPIPTLKLAVIYERSLYCKALVKEAAKWSLNANLTETCEILSFHTSKNGVKAFIKS